MSGWIKHDGSECPVPEGTLIDVKYRDAEMSCGVKALLPPSEQTNQFNPTAENWSHDGDASDIIAYRICEEKG